MVAWAEIGAHAGRLVLAGEGGGSQCAGSTIVTESERADDALIH